LQARRLEVEAPTTGQAIVLDGDGEVAGAEELGHAVLAQGLDRHDLDEAAVRHAHLHELRGARFGHDDHAAKGANRKSGAEERKTRLSIDSTRYARRQGLGAIPHGRQHLHTP